MLRLPAVYGPGDPHRRFGFIVDALDDGATSLPRKGRAEFRWTHGHVRDVAHAVRLSLVTAPSGVATYNVHPPKVGLYFQKIQCFCFEEQRLLPGETVDMPVFFFIDPEILEDAQVSYITDITLSYTFFQTDQDDDVD